MGCKIHITYYYFYFNKYGWYDVDVLGVWPPKPNMITREFKETTTQLLVH